MRRKAAPNFDQTPIFPPIGSIYVDFDTTIVLTSDHKSFWSRIRVRGHDVTQMESLTRTATNGCTRPWRSTFGFARNFSMWPIGEISIACGQLEYGTDRQNYNSATVVDAYQVKVRKCSRYIYWWWYISIYTYIHIYRFSYIFI